MSVGTDPENGLHPHPHRFVVKGPGQMGVAGRSYTQVEALVLWRLEGLDGSLVESLCCSSSTNVMEQNRTVTRTVPGKQEF